MGEVKRLRREDDVGMYELFKHSSQCVEGGVCSYRDCHRMMEVLEHPKDCQVQLKGGCVECRRYWGLLTQHAKRCEQVNCFVRFCDRIKAQIKRTKVVHTQAAEEVKSLTIAERAQARARAREEEVKSQAAQAPQATQAPQEAQASKVQEEDASKVLVDSFTGGEVKSMPFAISQAQADAVASAYAEALSRAVPVLPSLTVAQVQAQAEALSGSVPVLPAPTVAQVQSQAQAYAEVLAIAQAQRDSQKDSAHKRLMSQLKRARELARTQATTTTTTTQAVEVTTTTTTTQAEDLVDYSTEDEEPVEEVEPVEEEVKLEAQEEVKEERKRKWLVFQMGNGCYYEGFCRRSGIPHGECRVYSSRRKLLYEGTYKDGKRDGWGKEYRCGVLWYEGNFKDGKRV